MDENKQILGQKKMTNMLKVFHDICCKYNLNYWCSGGTLIGAVRHSGFIPWDGDVDVGMLIDDYNILIKYLQDELPSSMYFFGKSLPGLAKIRDLYSSYTDYSDKNDNNHHGLQLDIFIYILNEDKKIISIEKWLSDYKEDNYDYDSIFPLQLTKFDNIEVYIPNKIREICEFSYGGYPPPFPENKTCHEGRIDPINPAPYYLNIFKHIYDLKQNQQK
jgi:phosphorylcholine metabolism protein LicD